MAIHTHKHTHKMSHKPHARLTTPHFSDMPKVFNPIDTGAVRCPMSAIDPNSEGSGAAYPLRLSESVAHLLLAADRMKQTDDQEEKDGKGRQGGKVERGRDAS